MRSPLRWDHRVDLVDDDALDRSERVTREARQDEIEGLGRRDEDVRWLALVTGPLARRRVARPDRHGGLAVRDSETLRLPGDPDKRLSQIALDVDGECLEWRNVHDPCGGLLRCRRREHEAIDRGEERRERLAGARRCENEDGLAEGDRGPRELLRARRRLERGFEPRTSRWVERRERITPHEDRGYRSARGDR